MKLFKTLLVLSFLLVTTFKLHAQMTETTPSGKQKNNIVKLNVPALFFKKFSVQYERILNKKSGVALSVNLMPKSGLPLKSILLKAADGDAKSEKVINDMTLSNFALTPEYRFYLGKKGYGRGFYIAPFYRFTTYSVNLLPVTYTRDGGGDNTIDLSGTISCHTGGFMLGAQWLLGKSIALDWWIFGPHYGAGSGTFTGLSKEPLSQSEQDDIKETVDNIDLPIIKKTVTTSPVGAVLKVDGPWAGIRAGLSIGVRF